MPSKKLAALDVGTARIGIAVTDDSQSLALPYGTVHLKQSHDPIAEIASLLKSMEITQIVVGWPLELDGSEGPAVRRTKQFLAQFKTRFPEFRFKPQDERLTSVAAENALQEMETQGSDKKNKVDAMAASLILQMYLERKKH